MPLTPIRPQKIRRTFQLRPDQDAWIRQRAEETGESASAIVRRLLDLGKAAESDRRTQKRARS